MYHLFVAETLLTKVILWMVLEGSLRLWLSETSSGDGGGGQGLKDEWVLSHKK